MNVDLRPYAERLAKALPHIYEFLDHEAKWSLIIAGDIGGICLSSRDGLMRAWAFFGPLLDEFDVRPHGLDKAGHPGTLVFDGRLPWLESVAEAVCREAERRAGGG